MARRHQDLPALALIFDTPRLSAAVAELTSGEPVRVDRLRLKPGTSVRAALRTCGPTGRWWTLHGFSAETWPQKHVKDLHHATAIGVASIALPDQRLVMMPAAADRRLRLLAALRPDSGDTVELPKSLRRSRAVRMPPADVERATTLSYNPSRRWVGRLDTTQGTSLLARLHAGRGPELLPWTPGRPWNALDGSAGIRHAVSQGVAGRVPTRSVDVLTGSHQAAQALQALHPQWGDRARLVTDELHRRADQLMVTGETCRHGDLSPDQVVVDPSGNCRVLDWDRVGHWPDGWDEASWWVAQLACGFRAPVTLGVEPPAATLACAALLRAPEPFRRRRAGWVAATTDLLSVAEAALGGHRG